MLIFSFNIEPIFSDTQSICKNKYDPHWSKNLTEFNFNLSDIFKKNYEYIPYLPI